MPFGYKVGVYAARLRGNANVDLGIGYARGEQEINIYLVWWLVCIHWRKR